MQGVPSAASPENRMANDAGSPARSSEADAAGPAEEAPDGAAPTLTQGADGTAASAGADQDTGTAAAPALSAPGSPDPGGSPPPAPPATSDAHLLAPQQKLGSRPTQGSQRMQQPAPADPEQARQDAELEVSLSVLTHLRFDMHVWTCQPSFTVILGEPAALLHRILLVQSYTLVAKP